MTAYCKTDACLRGYILEYFGQEHPEACGNCGSCKGDFEEKDITREAQMILSCVKRVHDKLGYYVGATVISQVLRGSRDKRVLQLKLDSLSTYGLLKDRGNSQLRGMLSRLEGEGYLFTEQEHQTLRLTEEASQVLYRSKPVTMLVRKEQEEKHPSTAAAPTVRLTAEEEALYQVLRELRGKLAREADVPAYVIFSNATLQDMAKKKPRNISAFRKVSGVGELKASWYGEAFLQEIREFL